MSFDRRRFLRAAAITAVGAGAGCATETRQAETTAAGGDGAGATPATTASAGEFDFGGWLADTSNYDGTTADMRGTASVTVEVGVSGNDGAFAFGPPAVRVDPGTTVTWEWTGDGGQHNVVAESGADFSSGDPTNEAGHTFERTVDSAGVVK